MIKEVVKIIEEIILYSHPEKLRLKNKAGKSEVTDLKSLMISTLSERKIFRIVSSLKVRGSRSIERKR